MTGIPIGTPQAPRYFLQKTAGSSLTRLLDDALPVGTPAAGFRRVTPQRGRHGRVQDAKEAVLW